MSSDPGPSSERESNSDSEPALRPPIPLNYRRRERRGHRRHGPVDLRPFFLVMAVLIASVGLTWWWVKTLSETPTDVRTNLPENGDPAFVVTPWRRTYTDPNSPEIYNEQRIGIRETYGWSFMYFQYRSHISPTRFHYQPVYGYATLNTGNAILGILYRRGSC